MAVIYSVGNVSGAHINPAVTLGFVFAGRLKAKEAIPYVISQMLGAIIAAGVLRFLFPGHESLGSTLPGVSLLRSFVMEVLLSFILMFVVLNVSTGHMEKGIMAGVAVGGTVALAALMGGPMTGASMNPARSLGPALISGNLSSVWIYLTAPVVGAFLAHPFCRWIQGKKCCLFKEDEDEKDCG
jgi:aquaporin Z